MKDMKAISPIISIIILLLITIAIAGAGFSYISVYWTGLMSKQIEILPPYCSNNRATITLRNIGTSGINNSDHEAMIGLFEPDENTVGMWRFDETDGNASLDSSGQGNTGTIYGNTVLLMNFDEDDGNATLDSTSYGNIGTLYGNTRLLMHFDNGSGATTDDETSYGNDGTISGAIWKTSGCQSDKCLEFDGDGDYVEISNREDFNLSNSDEWSYFAWIYALETSPDAAVFCTEDGSGFNGMCFHLPSSQQLRLRIANATDNEVETSAGAISLNAWQHIGAVYDDSSDSVTFYINGANDSTKTYSTLTDSTGVSVARIGGMASSVVRYFNGTMDEVAVYSKALSQEEINTLYEAGRAKFIERKPGRSGNAIEFDGDGDYVNLGNQASMQFIYTDNFTLSAWIKTNDLSGFEHIVGKTYGNYRLTKSYRKISFRLDSNNLVLETPSILTIGDWYHLVAVYTDNKTAYIYVNGILNNSATDNTLDWTYTGGNFQIGNSPGESYYFNGAMDEVAVYSRALTANEVKAHYEAGKAKFIEHVQGRFGYGMGFDGDGDYVLVPTSSSLDIDNSSFTISSWFKLDGILNADTDKYQLVHWGQDYNNIWFMLRGGIYNGGFLRIYTDDDPATHHTRSFNTDQTAVLTDGNWHHFVGVMNNSAPGNYDLYLYLDGQPKGSKSVSGKGGILRDTGRVVIGTYYNLAEQFFNGTLDEVIIFNRSLSAEEIQAQVKPACSCSGNTCQCGELTVSRTLGQGYFHPYFDNGTFSPGQSLTMTDYNCMSGRCEYRITSPAGSYDATAVCS